MDPPGVNHWGPHEVEVKPQHPTTSSGVASEAPSAPRVQSARASAPGQREVECSLLALAAGAPPQPQPAQVSRHSRLFGGGARCQAARLRLGVSCVEER